MLILAAPRLRKTLLDGHSSENKQRTSLHGRLPRCLELFNPSFGDLQNCELKQRKPAKLQKMKKLRATFVDLTNLFVRALSDRFSARDTESKPNLVPRTNPPQLLQNFLRERSTSRAFDAGLEQECDPEEPGLYLVGLWVVFFSSIWRSVDVEDVPSTRWHVRTLGLSCWSSVHLRVLILPSPDDRGQSSHPPLHRGRSGPCAAGDRRVPYRSFPGPWGRLRIWEPCQPVPNHPRSHLSFELDQGHWWKGIRSWIHAILIHLASK